MRILFFNTHTNTSRSERNINKNNNLDEKKSKNLAKQKAQSLSLKLTSIKPVMNDYLVKIVSKNANDYFSLVPLQRYFLSLAERAHFLQIK